MAKDNLEIISCKIDRPLPGGGGWSKVGEAQIVLAFGHPQFAFYMVLRMNDGQTYYILLSEAKIFHILRKRNEVKPISIQPHVIAKIKSLPWNWEKVKERLAEAAP